MLSQINLPELNSSALASEIDESSIGLSFRRSLGEVSPPFHDLPNDLASFTQEINREYQTDMDINFKTCKRYRGSLDENIFDEPLSKEYRHLEEVDIIALLAHMQALEILISLRVAHELSHLPL